MPVTTATAEHSFSAMRRIKTYLRSTMGEERFSSLALLHVHRDKNIDVESIVHTFTRQKPRRLALI